MSVVSTVGGDVQALGDEVVYHDGHGDHDDAADEGSFPQPDDEGVDRRRGECGTSGPVGDGECAHEGFGGVGGDLPGDALGHELLDAQMSAVESGGDAAENGNTQDVAEVVHGLLDGGGVAGFAFGGAAHDDRRADGQ